MVLLLLLVCVPCAKKKCFAGTITASNGAIIGSGNNLRLPSFTVGGEYTISTSNKFELGAAYDYTFLRYNDGSSGALSFYGILGRISMKHHSAGPFFDVKAGFAQRSLGERTAGLAPAFATGVGYRIPISANAELMPRFGLRYVSGGQSGIPEMQRTPLGTLADMSLLFSFSF